MNVRSPMIIAALLLAVQLPVIAGQTTPQNQTPPPNGQTTDPAKKPDPPKPTPSAEDIRISQLHGDIKTQLRDNHNISISCKWDDGQCGPLYVTATAASTIELSLENFQSPEPVKIRMTGGERSDSGELLCSGIELDPSWQNVLISVHKGRRWAATATQAVANTCTAPKRAGSPKISLVTQGKTERLLIEIGGGKASLSVPLVYQRWFADTGGLIAFNLVRNERLQTTAVTGGKVMITEVRREERVEPTTGITVNLHPSSYPRFAAQFALSVGRENSRSYYLGGGWRLREAGERALATLTIGLAATEVRRFPGARQLIHDKTPLAPDSESLKPSREFAFGPYIGLSLGFSFGNLQPTKPAGQ